MYKVNEIFYSLQGEGIRAGTPNFFIRFANCNQTCKIETHGFDCDTEFRSGRQMTHLDMLEVMLNLSKDCKAIIFTGGEPGLQLTVDTIKFFKELGYYTAIETNGSIAVGELGLDWITVSPKVAEHALRQKQANEVKYVRRHGQGIPETVVQAEHYLVSPGFLASGLDSKDLEWCINLCKENPKWRLSVQQHKGWSIR